MSRISMLDCTLRDGGCVNNFDFGKLYMEQILDGIERSGVEIIELGYIDSAKGSAENRTQYCDEQVITKNFLKKKKSGVTYVAMIDYGKFDPEKLHERTADSIDGIRIAFHKKDMHNMISWGKKVIEKGYQLFVQPMTCLRYSDMEMLELIRLVNTELPAATAFYIVDSFGEMRLNDLNRIVNLVDHNLASNISLGLHSHNNLQLSYSNAVALLSYPTKRDLIFDSSIHGMGKGAGNMNTELFAEHLNIYDDKNYRIQPLLEVIDKAINQIRQSYSWGYSVEYYLSAANHCTPSYASHFYNKHMLAIHQVSELLGMIEENKKLSFDKDYAEKLYFEYNSRNAVHNENIEALKNGFNGKKLLLIAPGKSVNDNYDTVKAASEDENTISIGLNHLPMIHTDYIFVTKLSALDIVESGDNKLIVTSNVPVDRENVYIVDYTKLSKWKCGISDNATIMLVNLLNEIGIKEVMLAGFDGFSADMDQNYCSEELKRPINKFEAAEKNSLLKNFFSEMNSEIVFKFLTRSKYED